MADANLIIPLKEHYRGSVSMLYGYAMDKIKEKFEKVGLLERAKKSSFGQFFKRPEIKFSGVIIHQLLLRQVKSKSPSELHFYIGGRNLRFSAIEFALVTGLNFGEYPTSAEKKKYTCNNILLSKYLNNAALVKTHDLETVFLNAVETEDIWKLGLCYFVDTIIMAHEVKKQVDKGMLALVENEEAFFKYPWGRESYKRTLQGYRKDMVKLRAKYLNQLTTMRTRSAEAKYSLYGFGIALQYWAYEAIPNIGLAYAEKVGIQFPRMLSWTYKDSPSTKDLSALLNRKKITIFPILNPRPNEIDFHSTIRLTKLDEEVGGNVDIDFDDLDIDEEMMKEADEAAAIAKKCNVFQFTPEDEAKEDSLHEQGHLEKKIEKITLDVEVMKADLQTIKANQERLNKKIDILISTFVGNKSKKTSAKRRQVGLDGLESPIQHQSTPSPIQPQSTPTKGIQETMIGIVGMGIGDEATDPTPFKMPYQVPPQSSPSVKELAKKDVHDKVFKRRKLANPKFLGEDFTNPSGKQARVNDPCIVDPLRPYDPDQMAKFKRFIAEFDGEPAHVETGVGLGDVNWFVKLRTQGTWLDGMHIDAAFALFRERLWKYPRTYKKQMTIVDTIFEQFINGTWDAWRRLSAKNKDTFNWDERILEYVKGDASKWQKPWNAVDFVYLGMNINDNHWVLLEIDLSCWMITIFDSDQTLYATKVIIEKVAPMSKMLPHLLKMSGLFVSRPQLTQPFDIRRLQEDVVPRSTRSGDCGVYCIKHLEYLMAELSLSEVKQENIKFWREKLCIDIFFHNIEP